MNKILIGIVVLNTMLFGLLAYTQKPQKIVTLDVQHVMKQLVQEIAQKELGKEELEKTLKDKIAKMDASVLKLSKDKGYVVLSKSAVVSPCMDITEAVTKEVRSAE